MLNNKIFYILANDADKACHNSIIHELALLGYQGEVVHPYDITTEFNTNGKINFYHKDKLMNPALILGWVFEDILIQGMYLLNAFEQSGIPVVNTADTLFNGQNKYLNTVRFIKNNIPHFPVICGFSDRYLDAFGNNLTFPLVLKPIVSYGGFGIKKVNNLTELKTMAKEMADKKAYYYVQPYTTNPGYDLRVICINYKAIYAECHYAPEGGWITNYSSGGKAVPTILEEEIAILAEKASRCSNALISGVDIVEDINTGEYKVYEVNTCPTIYMEETEERIEAYVANFLVDFASESVRGKEPAHAINS